MKRGKTFTKNKYGITVVKCCASCRNKKCDNNVRQCTKGEGRVPSDYLCADWEMDEGLENAGKGGGKVKRAGYIRYATDALFSYKRQTAAATRGNDTPTWKSIADIRTEYEKTQGDIYEKL